MKTYLFLIVFTLYFCGCATYEKRIQLSPQKTAGWETESPGRYQHECNQGEVEVGPIVLGYASMGDFNLFIPIPTSKEGLRKANAENAWIYVQFRDINPIESCDLSYIFLVDQNSGKRIIPVRSMDIPANGRYKGKYTHGCHYYFDLDTNLEGDYMLHISEKVFNCKINPINYKKEKSFEIRPTELL